MIRDIERRKIFWNDQDREDFLERLSSLLPRLLLEEFLQGIWRFLRVSISLKIRFTAKPQRSQRDISVGE